METFLFILIAIGLGMIIISIYKLWTLRGQGPMVKHIGPLEFDILLLEFNAWPGDEVEIEATLLEYINVRRWVPKFFKYHFFVSYVAEWYCYEGIEISKDDRRYHGFVEITDGMYWRMELDRKMHDFIREERAGYWKTQADIKKDVDEMTLDIIGLNEKSPRFKEMAKDLIDLGEDGAASAAIFRNLDDRLEAEHDGPDMIIVADGETRIADFKSSDDLKKQYTPAELAQQAINRDKEEPLMDEPIVMHGPYLEEKTNIPDPDSKWGGVLNEDDGTMEDGVENLREAIVGHKIVKIERNVERPSQSKSWYNDNADLILTLDTGKRVGVIGQSDCCAYGEVENVIEKLPTLDHVITDVATTDGFTKWHILAGMEDVLELEVGWSPGNPFYYAYGVFIEVYDVPEAASE